MDDVCTCMATDVVQNQCREERSNVAQGDCTSNMEETHDRRRAKRTHTPLSLPHSHFRSQLPLVEHTYPAPSPRLHDGAATLGRLGECDLTSYRVEPTSIDRIVGGRVQHGAREPASPVRWYDEDAVDAEWCWEGCRTAVSSPLRSRKPKTHSQTTPPPLSTLPAMSSPKFRTRMACLIGWATTTPTIRSFPSSFTLCLELEMGGEEDVTASTSLQCDRMPAVNGDAESTSSTVEYTSSHFPSTTSRRAYPPFHDTAPASTPDRLLGNGIPRVTRAWCDACVRSSSPPRMYDIPHSVQVRCAPCMKCSWVSLDLSLLGRREVEVEVEHEEGADVEGVEVDGEDGRARRLMGPKNDARVACLVSLSLTALLSIATGVMPEVDEGSFAGRLSSLTPSGRARLGEAKSSIGSESIITRFGARMGDE